MKAILTFNIVCAKILNPTDRYIAFFKLATKLAWEPAKEEKPFETFISELLSNCLILKSSEMI